MVRLLTFGMARCCDYLFMLGLKLIHVKNGAPEENKAKLNYVHICAIATTVIFEWQMRVLEK